jgi:hypothetical protein
MMLNSRLTNLADGRFVIPGLEKPNPENLK